MLMPVLIIIFLISKLRFELISTEEFCNSEIFQPKCRQHKVIYIESAIYGRKDFGKCLKKEGLASFKYMDDPGFIGCYSDVRDVIQVECAGKQSCKIHVVGIKADTECLNFLKNHLNVNYSCERGECS